MMAFSPSAPRTRREAHQLWVFGDDMEFGGPINSGKWRGWLKDIEEGGGSLNKNESSAVFQSEK